MKLAQKIAINYLRAKLNIIAVISKRRAAKKALDIFSTPFVRAGKKPAPVFSTSEKLAFEMDGSKIVGHRWNVGGSKKLLIVHGFESSAANFGGYVSSFTRRGVNVVAFDAPAHGKSAGKKITLPKYIKTLQQIEKRYGPFDAYMAHSFGGLALALHLETHPHTAATKVAFLAPATETTTAIDSFFKFLDLTPQLRKDFDELILEKAGVRAEELSIRKAMHRIIADILWIHDEEDKTTPISDAQKVIDDGHINIRFVVTKGLGHRKIYRDETVMKTVMDFVIRT